MSKRFPVAPAHPERLCWGCDQYCPADDLRCGNGAERTQHPLELMGPEWFRAPGFEDLAPDAPVPR
ncbi:hypothetical protein HNQ51_002312 [Inhella inkyongensis]|uniref:DUF3079 domain-containing protein n=1 Tax=Inhella inkyongensis TaxID=392593 RepID=A0A840S5L3_9BURK|nr:DUF3079 domain-containing protein [Inhella inkyongensis]MBB5204993.1 hypothetical protein [Inhella inkyongensis]